MITHLVPSGDVSLSVGWLQCAEADCVRESLTAELGPLLRPHRGFRGFPDPHRSTCRLGDPGVAYVYNGRSHPLAPMGPALAGLRDRVSAHLGVPFNCAYVNLYASGLASLPRHSDTPLLPQLGPEPVIAAVSFGAPRLFQLWSAAAPRDRARMVEARLGHGDLCVMRGRSQSDWLHGVPKEPSVAGDRLSVTFRFHHPLDA